METKKFTLLLILLAVLSSSCRKHDLKPNNLSIIKAASAANTDVYIAGYSYALNGKSVVAYWKNGVLKKLSDSTGDGVGLGIVLQDTDVVIAGTITHSNTDNSTTALYWRNGRTIVLENKAEARSVTTSPCGCDLYVGGDARIDNAHIKAIYWKDGVRHLLPSNASSSGVNGMAIHGTDVYATGEAVIGNVAHAVYWKNDVLYNLTDSVTNSVANSIAINGNDVYVVGSLNDRATYWKNGVSIPLLYGPRPDATGIAKGIVIDNGDIYITGNLGAEGIGVYWKNGVATRLTIGAQQGGPSAIAVKNGNVYSSGGATFGNDVLYPVYWTNTAITRLPGSAYSVGSSIAVKTRL